MIFLFNQSSILIQFWFPGIYLRVAGFKMIYDAKTISHLMRVLKPPNDVSFDELQSMAVIKMNEVKQRTASGLEYAIHKHKQVRNIPNHLSIDF